MTFRDIVTEDCTGAKCLQGGTADLSHSTFLVNLTTLDWLLKLRLHTPKEKWQFSDSVVVEGVMLVLEGRYKPSKQRAWNSKIPTPLLVTPCLWVKAVPSVGLTSLTQNLFVTERTFAWTVVMPQATVRG